jgi:hypothetical protein
MSLADVSKQIVALEIELAAAQLRRRQQAATDLILLKFDVEHGIPVLRPQPIVIIFPDPLR